MATIVQRGFLFCPHVYLQRAKGISFLYACVPSCIFSTLKTCVSNSAFIFGKQCPYAAATRSFFFVVQRIRAAAQQNHIFIAFTILLCVACLLASFFLRTVQRTAHACRGRASINCAGVILRRMCWRHQRHHVF